MAITLTGGERQRKAGTFGDAQTYTQSTSTTPQELSITADCHILGMGTATGAPVRNLYTLADGIEGQEVWIWSLATGNAGVIFTQPSGRLPWQTSVTVNGGAATAVDAGWASATGQYVFQSAGDYIGAKYINAAWNVFTAVGATQATAS
jgi:hypothetical protein